MAMKKEDLVSLGLNNEQIENIFKMRGQEIEEAKTELEALKQEKQSLIENVESITKELENAKENQVDPEKLSALETEKSELEQKLEQMAADHAKELTSVQYNHLLESELKSAGAVDLEFAKIALGKLSEDAIKYEDGKLVGFEDALKTVKSEKAYLFAQEPKANDSKPKFTEKLTGGKGTNSTSDAFSAAFEKF